VRPVGKFADDLVAASDAAEPEVPAAPAGMRTLAAVLAMEAGLGLCRRWMR
jgi:hypothetical protein